MSAQQRRSSLLGRLERSGLHPFSSTVVQSGATQSADAGKATQRLRVEPVRAQDSAKLKRAIA